MVESVSAAKTCTAEEIKRKELDKPIQIQKGPKSTITGDAEAEIERIYKELWAKQNSDKNAVILVQEEVLAKVRNCLLYTSPSPRDS